MQRTNKKSWFFEKTNNIDELLPNSTKVKRELQTNKIRNEKSDITTGTGNKKNYEDIILYFNNLYCTKLENVKHNLSDTYYLPKLNQDRIRTLKKKPINSSVIEAIIKSPPIKKKIPEANGFSTEFYYQTFKVELMPILLKLFHKIET